MNETGITKAEDQPESAEIFTQAETFCYKRLVDQWKQYTFEAIRQEKALKQGIAENEVELTLLEYFEIVAEKLGRVKLDRALVSYQDQILAARALSARAESEQDNILLGELEQRSALVLAIHARFILNMTERFSFISEEYPEDILHEVIAIVLAYARDSKEGNENNAYRNELFKKLVPKITYTEAETEAESTTTPFGRRIREIFRTIYELKVTFPESMITWPKLLKTINDYFQGRPFSLEQQDVEKLKDLIKNKSCSNLPETADSQKRIDKLLQLIDLKFLLEYLELELSSHQESYGNVPEDTIKIVRFLWEKRKLPNVLSFLVSIGKITEHQAQIFLCKYATSFEVTDKMCGNTFNISREAARMAIEKVSRNLRTEVHLLACETEQTMARRVRQRILQIIEQKTENGSRKYILELLPTLKEIVFELYPEECDLLKRATYPQELKLLNTEINTLNNLILKLSHLKPKKLDDGKILNEIEQKLQKLLNLLQPL